MGINYTELNASTQKNIVPMVVSQIQKKSPLLKELIDRKKVADGGTKIAIPLRTGDLLGGSIAFGGTFDTTYVDIHDMAEFDIKTLYVNLTDDGMLAAQNKGKNAIFNLMKEKTVAMSDTMAKILGNQLYVVGGGNNLDGLGSAISDSNTYGGINRLTVGNEYWRSKIFANGAVLRAVTLKLLEQFYLAVTKSGTETEGLYFTTSDAVFTKIWELLMSKNQVVETNAEIANLGFRNIRFNGVTILPDPYLAGNNTFYAINLKHFFLNTWSEADFKMRGFVEIPNQWRRVNQLLVMGNLGCDQAELLGKITDLDPNL